MRTPLCVKLRTQHGGKEPDSLCAGLMLSFRKQLEQSGTGDWAPAGEVEKVGTEPEVQVLGKDFHSYMSLEM